MPQRENFKNFLILHDCYDSYCNNLDNQRNSTFDAIIDPYIILRPNLLGIIDSTLVWDNTDQGSNFWSDINSKWNDAVRSNKKFTIGYKSIW